VSKALIVLAYYERPNMVRNALNSIARQGASNWDLAVIDDGSPTPVEPIVREILSSYQDRIKFYRCEDTKEQKLAQGGSRHGAYINQAMTESDADYVVILCDDDALVDGSIRKLINYYDTNPGSKWSYGHVIPYDPSRGPPPFNTTKAPKIWLNKTGSINPACQVDSSQVSFRRQYILEVGYPSPMTAALDAAVFNEMHRRHGLCPFNGVVVQHKGSFSGQMGNRPIGERYEIKVN
jgi:cellulose synthase/poly-beta-1,6-N-acetylglucosamine synthase-like glycosyltransferase